MTTPFATVSRPTSPTILNASGAIRQFPSWQQAFQAALQTTGAARIYSAGRALAFQNGTPLPQ